MRVSDALEWLSALDGDAELAVTAAFPELDGWEVTSWALRPGEAEAGPCIGIDVFGADFDYPGFERALAREARAFLERLGGEAPKAAGIRWRNRREPVGANGCGSLV